MKGQTAGTSLQEWHMMVTDQSYIGFNRWLDEPIAERTIHYYADPAARYQHSAEAYAGGANPGEVFPTAFVGALRSYQPGETASETLLGQVVHGGLLPNPASPAQSSVRREGDTLMIDLPYRVDGDGNPNIAGPDGGTDSRFQLWVDDELYVTGEYANGYGEVPAEAHTYRVLLDSDRYERWWTQSTEVSTEWSFTSSTTDALTVLPLLQLDYGVQGLDALNVAAGKRISLTPTVSHQDGSTGAAISGLKLWASYDGGRTWTTIAVTGSAGAYSASHHPAEGHDEDRAQVRGLGCRRQHLQGDGPGRDRPEVTRRAHPGEAHGAYGRRGLASRRAGPPGLRAGAGRRRQSVTVNTAEPVSPSITRR